MKKKKAKVRVPSKFLKHSEKGSVKKKYMVRVPSKFLEKSGITTKKKMKVRVPSKFFEPITKGSTTSDGSLQKKKLKVTTSLEEYYLILKKCVLM